MFFAVILLFVNCNNSPSGQKNDNQNNPDNSGEQNPGDVEQDDKLYQIYFESDELTFDLAEEKSLSAVVKDKNGNIIEDALITFSSGKEELLSINENSKAKAKMIGDVVITAAATINDKEISSNLNCKIIPNALEFSSDKSFKIGGNAWKNTNGEYFTSRTWDSILYYYSYTNTNYVEWDGLSEIDSYEVNGKSYLFLRGEGNTTFYQNGAKLGLYFIGENISCKGDIRYLLNYSNVENATMKEYCFWGMFYGAPLVTLPDLPFITLSRHCYHSMFSGCDSLVEVPKDYLPAIKLTEGCYCSMFYDCKNLKTPPALPATELASDCYLIMFSICKELTSIPYFGHITSLEGISRAFFKMFDRCDKISLVKQKDDTHIYEYRLPVDNNSYSKYDERNYASAFVNTSAGVANGYWGDYYQGYYNLYPNPDAPYYVSNEIIYPDGYGDSSQD